MKRSVMLLILVLWMPAAMAGGLMGMVGTPASAAAVDASKKKVEYHGVGIVNRVERIIGLINISHGDVPFAGWTAYTRDVRVRPRELTQVLKPGMQIKFQLTAAGPHTWVITALEPVE